MNASTLARRAMPADVRLMNAVAGIVMGGIVLMLLAAGIGWAVRQPYFEIREIEIKGELHRTSVTAIRANAAPRLAGNFFTLNLDAARAAFESVPWVREAQLRRVWPDRLEVELEEHVAAALWQSTRDLPDGDRLVNDHGEVFQANVGEVEDEGLPLLRGPEGSAASMLAVWRRIDPVLKGMGLPVAMLELSGRGSWTAIAGDETTLELGRGDVEVLGERVERFARTLPDVRRRYEGRALLYADLRHPDAYALRLQGIETTATPPRPPANRGRGRPNPR